MFRFSRWIIFLLALAGFVVGGCDREEPEPSANRIEAPAKPPPRVVVPEEVQGRWQAVEIAVIDKDDNHREVYTVDIGGSVEIPDTGLTLTVETFLPAFIMEGTTMTSAGNELNNPGVQVVVSQNGDIVYKGWLFSLYPGTHAFKHPRYGFTLVDFVPAE